MEFLFLPVFCVTSSGRPAFTRFAQKYRQGPLDAQIAAAVAGGGGQKLLMSNRPPRFILPEVVLCQRFAAKYWDGIEYLVCDAKHCA